MIRALLAGRKTQTRRLLTPANTYFNGRPWDRDLKADKWAWDKAWVDAGPSPAGNPGPYLKLPYAGDTGYLKDTIHRIYPKIQFGDRLWVRETGNWRGPMKDMISGRMMGFKFYAADSERGRSSFFDDKNKSAIFMPRWASRITLTVTEVRIQRLLDISDEDAWAEGVCQFVEDSDPVGWDGLSNEDRSELVRMTYGSAVHAYRHLWETINGSLAWDEDPWVSAYTFTVHHANIDALPAPDGEGR